MTMKFFSVLFLWFVIAMLVSADELPTKTVCRQPKRVGRCDALMPSFYYDAAIGQCQPFNYGGCGGNDNKFDTLEECEKKCKGITAA